MKITDMPHGQVEAAIQRLFAEISHQNGDKSCDIINRIKNNESYRKEIVSKMSRSGYQPNKNHKRAKSIMGQNMFGIDDAINHFGVYPLEDQLKKLSEIRTSKGRLIDEKELRKYKNTHILVAIFPVYPLKTISDENNPLFINEMSFKLFHDTDFSIDKNDIGWYLIRKSPFEKSFNKEWVHQIQILPLGETIPRLYMVGYMIAGHFLNTGEKLFVRQFVRCANSPLQTLKTKPLIGLETSSNKLNGLILEEKLNSISSPYIGLASMISQE